MADGGMHHHYRAAFIVAGFSALALGGAVFATVAPGAAEVTGIAAGGVAALAGGNWAARKLGIKPKGQRWRARMSRTKAARSVRSGIARTGKLARSLPKAGAGKLRRGLGRLGGSRAGPGRRGLLGRRTGSGKRLGRFRPFGKGGGKAGGKSGVAGGVRRRLRGWFKRPSGKPQGKTSPAAPSRSRLRGAVKAVRGTWRKARKAAGVKNSRGWRKAARIAGAVALLPVFGAAGAAHGARAMRRRQPAASAKGKQNGTATPKKKKAKNAKPVPVPAPRGSRPAYPARVRRTAFYGTGGPAMNNIEAAAEAATDNIGRWEPENAADLDQFLQGLPDYFSAVAQSFAHVAETLSDRYPVHPVVVERLREIGATIGGMTDFSADAYAIHRTAHDRELQRIENPRPGEDLWDVSKQQ